MVFRLTLDQIVVVMRQVAECLKNLHGTWPRRLPLADFIPLSFSLRAHFLIMFHTAAGQGLLHGDLKPLNVVRSYSGQVTSAAIRVLCTMARPSLRELRHNPLPLHLSVHAD